jgi:hypothetical protein
VDIGGIAGQVTMYVGAAGAAGLGLRWVWRGSRALHRLAEGLLGDGDRPSAMVRLAAIEAELRPNHGSSLRDAVDRVEQRLDEHLDEHRQQRV